MNRKSSNLFHFSATLLSSIFVTFFAALTTVLAPGSQVFAKVSGGGNQPDGEVARWLWANHQREAEKLGLRNSEELKSYLTISEVSSDEDPKIFTEEELKKTDWLLQNSTNLPPNSSALSPNPKNFGDAWTNILAELGDIKRWITVGKKIWDVIRNNQPVINVKTQSIAVLPDVSPNWMEMEKWQGPVARSYTIAAKNLYGATVISHTYTVAFHYGGSLSGKGQFLANATIIPTKVSVAWGFSLDSDVKVGQPLNTGTRSNPIPGIDLSLEWSMRSVFKKMQGIDQFHVRGDGESSHVNLY